MEVQGPDAVVRVCLLGKLQVERDEGRPLVTFAQRAAQLIGYLAVKWGRAQRRDSVAEALWPGCSPVYSRTYLRRALWQARKGLGFPPQDASLIADQEWIELVPSGRLVLDVVELGRLYDRLARADAGDPAFLGQCMAVAELYRGDLLDDWTEDWCVLPRERYRMMYVTMLEWIVEQIVDRQPVLAQAYCQRLLELDSAHEWAHQAMMRSLWAAGDRTRALRQFELCRDRLDRELSIGPSTLTFQLRDEIIAERPHQTSGSVRLMARSAC